MRGKKRPLPMERPTVNQLEAELAREKYRRRYGWVLRSTIYTLITVAATGILFGIRILHKEDWKAVDVTTLIFLTAAFAIGGVMKACGAADIVFGLMRGIFPAEFSARYLFVMILVSMLLHMILGSNTTTLSVVVPGMMLLCGQTVDSPVIVFTAILSVSFHAVLPFHSVSMMVGASNGYFPSGYVTRMGLPTTILVYLAAAGVFLPYWKWIGLIWGAGLGFAA